MVDASVSRTKASPSPIGSIAASPPKRGKRISAGRAGSCIAAIALGYLLALPPLFRLWLPLPDVARIAITAALVAPLAFAMGIPFPAGIARLASEAAALIPWAWGVNACASVVAAVGATLLAIHLGFGAVVVLAVAIYAVAAAARW